MKAYVLLNIRAGDIASVIQHMKRVEGVSEATMTFGPYDGVAVIEVLPGSPADKAGLRGSQRTVNVGSIEFSAGGDVITAVNGVQLMNAEQLNLLITYEGQAGDQLNFTLLRDGQEMNVTVTLELLD